MDKYVTKKNIGMHLDWKQIFFSEAFKFGG